MRLARPSVCSVLEKKKRRKIKIGTDVPQGTSNLVECQFPVEVKVTGRQKPPQQSGACADCNRPCLLTGGESTASGSGADYKL